MCDLLWSDPEETDGFQISPRGAGYVFGKDVSEEFCFKNKLNMIARAHQCIPTGFAWKHNDKVCTIFSAPNYCYRCANLGAFMEVDEFLVTKL
jgi:diadenosine tetraphosphatase ApaH/serine/threonine PP2A family protein phosphatase